MAKLPQTKRLPEVGKNPKTLTEAMTYIKRLKVDLEKMYAEIANAVNLNRDGRNDV